MKLRQILNEYLCHYRQAHALTVKKLAFRPVIDGTQMLASCGEDNLLRVYAIKL